MNTNMTDEEALIKGFLMDMTQSQGLMTGTEGNLQNVISEAKLAIMEFDKEQADLVGDEHKSTDTIPCAPVHSLETKNAQEKENRIGLVTPPTRHAKSPSVTQIQQNDAVNVDEISQSRTNMQSII